jgi:peptide/nickel transport system substrate-binding protein
MRIRRRKSLALVLLGLAFIVTPAVGQQSRPASVLRVVPPADLRTLDPMFEPIGVTRTHATMVYETLFAWTSTMESRPQMVGDYTTSADGLVWQFRLRDGLRFHDGQPVTSEDVVASLRRWMPLDVVGQKLAEFTVALDVIDPQTFAFRLSRPVGFLPFALGSAVGRLPSIMRAADAAQPPGAGGGDVVGSGPFRFNAAEWRSGARVVYDRNRDYVPRQDAADGLAGGRIVKVDRVEWTIIPDPATAAAALQRGEVDVIEQPSLDILPVLLRNRSIRVERLGGLSNQAILRPNALHPPFNDARSRRALAMLIDQGDVMSGGFGDERFWRRCRAFFLCGGPFQSHAGTEDLDGATLADARRLLEQGGYRGERLTLITTNEIAQLGRMAEVVAAALRRGGVDVDVQYADWAATVGRVTRKDPPAQRGWNLFVTTSAGPTIHHPLTNIGTNMSCDGRNWVGWPCDPAVESLRQVAIEAGADTRRAAADALQARLAEVFPYIPLGEVDQPFARRIEVTGMLTGPLMVFWNVSK